MLTNLGKLLRVMRIEENESMRDMAAKLNLSLSYLSAIENGKRNVPADLEETILNNYHLSEERKVELKDAIKESVDKVKVHVNDLDDKRKEVLLALTNDDLDDDTLELLCEVVRKGKK